MNSEVLGGRVTTSSFTLRCHNRKEDIYGDVSEHLGVINWDAVKGNVDGVIIHCGYADNIVSQDGKQ